MTYHAHSEDKEGQDFWTAHWTSSDSADKYTTCTVYSVKLGSGVDIGTAKVRLRFIHFVPPKGSLLLLYKSDPCYLIP